MLVTSPGSTSWSLRQSSHRIINFDFCFLETRTPSSNSSQSQHSHMVAKSAWCRNYDPKSSTKLCEKKENESCVDQLFVPFVMLVTVRKKKERVVVCSTRLRATL